jgi:hypothetical protein
MEGQDQHSFESLAGLAHELGHCLFERQVRTSGAIDVISEAVAQYFESEVVSGYLRKENATSDLSTWLRYQDFVDSINLLFFLQEARDVFECGIPALPVRFYDCMLVFRESLFTLPGYQRVYFQASVMRNQWQRSGLSLEEVLDDARSLARASVRAET